MRVHDIIFQGLFDARTPVKLTCEDHVSKCDLPPGLSVADVQNVVLAVLYPSHLPSDLKVALARSQDVKIALTLSSKSRRYRILRKGPLDSLKLQGEDGGKFAELASGKAVEKYLEKACGLPDFEAFWNINIWRFDASSSESSRFDIDVLEPRLKDLVEKYRIARRSELADDRVKSLEGRIADARRELGPGSALEEKLIKAREKYDELEIGGLSVDDMELLRSKDERLDDFQEQIDRLEHDQDVEKERVTETLPKPWFEVPHFWAGVAIAVASVGLAVANQDSSLRAAALVDILGFGMCAWVLINYFNGMERASVHQVRLDSIKRRLNQVREEQVSLKERLNHLLVHAKVEGADELDERVAKTEKLRAIIGKLEEQVGDLSRDDNYARAKAELGRLNKELAQAMDEKASLPTSVMSAYQLENDLADLGIDPAAVVEDSEDAADERSELERLVGSATELGQWDGSKLAPKTRKMWGKIAGHVLGERFKSVDLNERGELEISKLGSEQVDMWKRTRPSEYRALLSALALSIQVNAEEYSRRGFFSTIVIPDPSTSLPGEQATKFTEVFGSAAKRAPVLILKPHSW